MGKHERQANILDLVAGTRTIAWVPSDIDRTWATWELLRSQA